jgi:hypothetical protein
MGIYLVKSQKWGSLLSMIYDIMGIDGGNTIYLIPYLVKYYNTILYGVV